jgi:hypothetical protein
MKKRVAFIETTPIICACIIIHGHECSKKILFLHTYPQEEENSCFVEFEILVVVTMENTAFWDVMPCSLVYI